MSPIYTREKRRALRLRMTQQNKLWERADFAFLRAGAGGQI